MPMIRQVEMFGAHPEALAKVMMPLSTIFMIIMRVVLPAECRGWSRAYPLLGLPLCLHYQAGT